LRPVMTYMWLIGNGAASLVLALGLLASACEFLLSVCE